MCPMNVAPQTWHHGLVARWWAEFNKDGPELDYFRSFVERAGQPALDVACGTGRLLLPYLRAGLDVDGCDVSADMIALCREQAEHEGLTPTLFVQAMHELDPPRSYRTIFVCGGFGLGSERGQDLQALGRFFEHLVPGGTLVLDNEVPYADAKLWSRWPKGERGELPRPWGSAPEPRRALDGNDYALQSRLVELDPLEQRATMEIRAYQWRDGVLQAEEEHTLTMGLYFKNELLLMLERAGFVDVVVHGDHTPSEPNAESDFVVFIARKPV
jgi:SAM-dependent methyltransferase